MPRNFSTYQNWIKWLIVHLYLPELPRVQREIQPILVFAGAEEAVVDLFSEGRLSSTNPPQRGPSPPRPTPLSWPESSQPPPPSPSPPGDEWRQRGWPTPWNRPALPLKYSWDTPAPDTCSWTSFHTRPLPCPQSPGSAMEVNWPRL